MVVVPGEVLGELVAGEVVRAVHPVHDPRLFEDGEVAVHRALGEARTVLEDLGDGEGSIGALQDLDDRAAVGGVTLVAAGEALGHRRVQVHARERTRGSGNQ